MLPDSVHAFVQSAALTTIPQSAIVAMEKDFPVITYSISHSFDILLLCILDIHDCQLKIHGKIMVYIVK